jgi:hypothetical protein
MFDARLRAEKDKWLNGLAKALSFLTPNQVRIFLNPNSFLIISTNLPLI